jgi:5-formyltetrahydrofolate cyclo-ligase
MNAIDAEKSALRAALLDRRRGLCGRGGEAARRVAENFVAEIPIEAGTAVSGYLPINGEIDVRPLLAGLGVRGHPLALPVVTAPRSPLAFRAWVDGAPLEDGPFGTCHPAEAAVGVVPDLLVVPLLAFDRAGRRLGYGGGYYDRTLMALRTEKSVLAVGVAYSEQEVADVPCDDTDALLDWVVTDREVIATGAGL